MKIFGTLLITISAIGLAIAFPFLWLVYLAYAGYCIVASYR